MLTISRSSSSPQRDFCQTPTRTPLFLLPICPLRIQNAGPGHTLDPNIKTSPRLLYFLCNPFLFLYRLTHAFEMASFCLNGHSRNRRALLLPKLNAIVLRGKEYSPTWYRRGLCSGYANNGLLILIGEVLKLSDARYQRSKVYYFYAMKIGTSRRSPWWAGRTLTQNRYGTGSQYLGDSGLNAFLFRWIAQEQLTSCLSIFVRICCLSSIQPPSRRKKMRPLRLIEPDRKIILWASA